MSDTMQEYIRREAGKISESDVKDGLAILQQNAKNAVPLSREELDELLSPDVLNDVPIEAENPPNFSGGVPAEVAEQRKIIATMRENAQGKVHLPEDAVKAREEARKNAALSDLQKEIFGSSDEDAKLAAKAIAENRSAVNIGEVVYGPAEAPPKSMSKMDELGLKDDSVCEFEDII